MDTQAKAAPAAFDIDNLDAITLGDQGADCKIMNPSSGSYTGITVRIKGAFAPAFQERLARVKRKEAIRQRNAVARAVAPDDDDETSRVLAEMTLGWSTMIGEGEQAKPEPVLIMRGERLQFTRENAVKVYEAYPVIRGQVFAFAMDTANFTKG